MIGSTLSHFRVTAKLGEGGMGEVYRAEDTKLGREVAIKVLPEAVARDPERLGRFEREAKVLASLNHPNIAAIYSFESAERAGTEARPYSGASSDVGEPLAGSRREGASPSPTREREGASPSPTDVEAGHRARPSDVHFLVMELVDGMTLRDRLDRGPLPLDEVLPIARQMALALEAAHAQGIIHRDLKPANVMVDAEENVKVLDFGLAKALDPRAGTEAGPYSGAAGVGEPLAGSHEREGASPSPTPSPMALSLSPTLTAQMTSAGVLLGTAAYMSPEQARGKTADKRADIWAFGVVLWEMLTGQRLFEGETVSDTLAGVLRADPDWDALAADIPEQLRRVLRRCLERNPKDRLHDVADARIEIEEAMRSPAPSASAVADGSFAATSTRRGSLWIGAAAGLVVGALLTALVASKLSDTRTVSPRESVRVASATPEGRPVKFESSPMLALSADGQQVVVAAGEGDARQLYRRTLGQYDWLPIPGTEKADQPIFSPDGEWLGFTADGKLKKVSLAGGAPQVLCDAPNSFGATWGPDGFIVFNPSSPGGLLRVSELGGAPEALVKPDREAEESELNWPQFLTGGDALVFTAWRGDSVEGSQISLLDLATGERKLLANGGYGRVTPSGHLLYTLADGVYVAPFDPERREVTGAGVPLPEPVFRFSPYWLPAMDFSASGTLAYLPGRSDVSSQLVTVSLDGTEEVLVEQPGAYMYPRLSPDGRKLAVNLIGAGGAGIWIVDLVTGTRSPLTRGGNNLYPLWTPDGQRIVYLSDENGIQTVLWRAADGSGEAETLVASAPPIYYGFPTGVTPDGKFLILNRWENNEDDSFKADVLVAMSLENPAEQQDLMVSRDKDLSHMSGTVSPDGAWIAYVESDDVVGGEVFIQRFPDGGARIQVSQGGGIKPQWGADGSEIYFRAQGQRFMVARVSTEPTFATEVPRLLFKDLYDRGTYVPMPNYSIAPDGSKIVMIKPDEELGKASEIRLVLDWFAELEKLVPGGGR